MRDAPADTPQPLIAAPGGFYLDAEHHLRLLSLNSAAGVTLTVTAQIMLASGEVVWFTQAHTPNTDRTSANTNVFVADGWLMNATIFVSGGSPRIGQTFARLDVIRGRTGAIITMASLLAGYVTAFDRLVWPQNAPRSSVAGRGVLRSVAGTDPAANTEISETVPTDARWRVLAIQVNLVTDATAANREVSLLIDDGTTVFARVPVGTNHAASLTRTYSFATNTARNTIAQDPVLNAPLPELVLGDGFRVRTVTTNLQATDNYGAPQLLVEEWIED